MAETLAGVPFDVLLVALCGVWCHSSAVPDRAHVQVSFTAFLVSRGVNRIPSVIPQRLPSVYAPIVIAGLG